MLSTDFETDKRMKTDLVVCGEVRHTLRVESKEVHGEDFPGETVRVVKEKDVRLYGEYRTRRLVLEAWDNGQG